MPQLIANNLVLAQQQERSEHSLRLVGSALQMLDLLRWMRRGVVPPLLFIHQVAGSYDASPKRTVKEKRFCLNSQDPRDSGAVRGRFNRGVH